MTNIWQMRARNKNNYLNLLREIAESKGGVIALIKVLFIELSP